MNRFKPHLSYDDFENENNILQIEDNEFNKLSAKEDDDLFERVKSNLKIMKTKIEEEEKNKQI